MVREHRPDSYDADYRARRVEQLLRRVAAAVGVDVSDLYPEEADV